MDGIIRLIETYGVGAVLTLVLIFAIWKLVKSNADVNVAAGKQINTALALAASSQKIMADALQTIKANTAAIEKSFSALAENNETFVNQIAKAADGATMERAAQNRLLDKVATELMAALDDMGARINGGITLADFKEIVAEFRPMITSANEAIQEIKAAVIAPPV